MRRLKLFQSRALVGAVTVSNWALAQPVESTGDASQASSSTADAEVGTEEASESDICPANNFVAVAIDIPEESSIEAAVIVEQLRAGLAVSEVGVCRARAVPDELEPLAVVRIVLRDEAAFDLTLAVEDSVTVKKVSRQVDLSKIPEDSRSLAVAIHVEELLRASWAEVMLRREAPGEKPAADPPKVVTKVVQRGERPDRAPFRLAVGGSVAMYAANLTLLGPTAKVGYAPLEWLEIHARVAPRWGLNVDTDSGTVSSQNLLLGLSARGLTGTLDQVRTLGELEIRAQHLSFSAMPTGGFLGRKASGWGADASLGAGASIPLVPRLSLDVVGRGVVVLAGVVGLDFDETAVGLVDGGAEVTMTLSGRL